MASPIHIGKLIQKEFKNSGMTVAEFAKKIGVVRNVAYDVFKRKSIQTDMLDKVCLALKIDFFEVYSKGLKLKINK